MVIRNDNGPQFRVKAFTEALHKMEIIHARITVNSPNLNAADRDDTLWYNPVGGRAVLRNRKVIE